MSWWDTISKPFRVVGDFVRQNKKTVGIVSAIGMQSSLAFYTLSSSFGFLYPLVGLAAGGYYVYRKASPLV